MDIMVNQNIITKKFPFLPAKLTIEALKCRLPIQGYTAHHPPKPSPASNT